VYGTRENDRAWGWGWSAIDAGSANARVVFRLRIVGGLVKGRYLHRGCTGLEQMSVSRRGLLWRLERSERFCGGKCGLREVLRLARMTTFISRVFPTYFPVRM